MTFEIEKSIPAPEGHRAQKYPFGKMNVNDSFLVPCESGDYMHAQSRVGNAMRGYAKRRGNGWGGKTGKVEGGVRIWRTA